MAGELSPLLDGIKVVADAATRDAIWPLATRPQNARVQRLDTNAIERWSGSAWLPEFGATLFDVRRFHAVGDGVTSDRTAILAAWTAAAAVTNGAIYFPRGTYLLDGADVFLSARVVCEAGAIIKVPEGTNLYLLNGFDGSPSQHFDATPVSDTTKGCVAFSGSQVPVIYPQWWGAVGDGTTDDTKPIQSAIDASAYNNSHTGVPVELPAGRYMFSTLNLAGSIGSGGGVWLRGAGRYATILLTTTANATVITANGAGCRLSALRLQTAVAVTPLSSQILFKSASGAGVVVDFVDFYKFYRAAQVNGVSMYDCNLDYGVAGGTAIHILDGVGNSFVRVVTYTRYDATGFHIESAGTTTPDTNVFIFCSTNAGQTPDEYATYGTPNTGIAGVGVSVKFTKSGVLGPGRWNRFFACFFETQSNSAGVSCVQYTAGQNTTFEGCYILGGQYGVILNGASADYIDALQLTSTIVQGANNMGVYHVPADATYIAAMTLTDCQVVENSQASVGGFPGITLGANSRGFTMRGGASGISLGNRSTTPRQSIGITVTAGAEDFYIDLDSIDLAGNVSGPTSGLVPIVASASTITPVSQRFNVSGTSAIATITAPRRFRTLYVIPTGIFTWTTAGNIALAGTAVVGKLLVLTYLDSPGKWYPSYT